MDVLLEDAKMAKHKSIPVKKCEVPEPSIQEIEQRLGFDEVRPVALTPTEQAQLDQDADEFRKWYERDLRAYYRSLTEPKSRR